jgi:hypothetical protein
VTQLQSTRHPGRDGTEAPMHPLTHRLQGLEAIGRPRSMDADDFRIGVFHGDEDIGLVVIVCVMSVPHISLTLSVMIVPSCGLVSVRRDAARASRSRASPVAHDGGLRERPRSAIGPAVALAVKAGIRGLRPYPGRSHGRAAGATATPPRPPQRWCYRLSEPPPPSAGAEVVGALGADECDDW